MTEHQLAAERAASAPHLERSSPLARQLAGLPIFNNLDRVSVEQLFDSSSSKQFEAGELVVRQGERTPVLHVIERGIVDLTHLSGRSECGVLLLSAKDLLLPATTLFQEPALVSARALTSTKILMLQFHAVERATERSPAFATNLMKAMSGQWRMAVRNILDLNCRSAAQRVGAFLLHLADVQTATSGEALLPIAKRHLAVRMGIKPETLSRVLQTVADHGLYLRGRTIVIRDRASIERFCGPDPYPAKDETSLNVFAL